MDSMWNLNPARDRSLDNCTLQQSSITNQVSYWLCLVHVLVLKSLVGEAMCMRIRTWLCIWCTNIQIQTIETFQLLGSSWQARAKRMDTSSFKFIGILTLVNAHKIWLQKCQNNSNNNNNNNNNNDNNNNNNNRLTFPGGGSPQGDIVTFGTAFVEEVCLTLYVFL